MNAERSSHRDWLAGQALNGLLSGPSAETRSSSESPAHWARRLASESYLLADAMLKEGDLGAQKVGHPEAKTTHEPVGTPNGASSSIRTKPASVRINGNWRNPNKMEWGGAPVLDTAGHLERLDTIPEQVRQAVEQELVKGAVEGIKFLEDGTRIDWFVDR